MLCDKVEGQRWCGTKLGVKDGVCERGCASKMVSTSLKPTFLLAYAYVCEI